MRYFAIAVFLIVSAQSPRADELSEAVYFGINAIRSSQGLSVLDREHRLESAAKSHADWMLANRRMDHLREPPKNLDDFKVCNYHPANRVVNSGYFSFDELFTLNYNDSGVEVVPKGIANTHVSEIIAVGTGGGMQVRRPDIIMQGWMRSPGHRKVVLTPHFKEFGVGVSGAGGDVYWCVVFASREK